MSPYRDLPYSFLILRSSPNFVYGRWLESIHSGWRTNRQTLIILYQAGSVGSWRGKASRSHITVGMALLPGIHVKFTVTYRVHKWHLHFPEIRNNKCQHLLNMYAVPGVSNAPNQLASEQPHKTVQGDLETDWLGLKLSSTAYEMVSLGKRLNLCTAVSWLVKRELKWQLIQWAVARTIILHWIQDVIHCKMSHYFMYHEHKKNICWLNSEHQRLLDVASFVCSNVGKHVS